MNTLADKVKEALEGATPGPWGNDRDLDVVDRNGHMVADLLVLDDNPSPVDKANATLIALIPDLARAYLEVLEERDRLREALRPFAEVLSHYTFGPHQLILLSEDNPKGRRLAHLLPEQFAAARAALKQEDLKD